MQQQHSQGTLIMQIIYLKGPFYNIFKVYPHSADIKALLLHQMFQTLTMVRLEVGNIFVDAKRNTTLPQMNYAFN